MKTNKNFQTWNIFIRMDSKNKSSEIKFTAVKENLFYFISTE